MGETFLSLLAPRSLRARRAGPSVQGGPGAPGVNAGPRPWTEGHGGLAQAELTGSRARRLPARQWGVVQELMS